MYISVAKAPPTLGAPSWRTTSNRLPPDSLCSFSRHDVVVMSSTNVFAPRTGLIGTKSTPMMRAEMGRCFAHTCSQPPGAAHRSSTPLASFKKPCFLFNWMSLNAARERYLQPLWCQEVFAPSACTHQRELFAEQLTRCSIQHYPCNVTRLCLGCCEPGWHTAQSLCQNGRHHDA